MAYNPNKELKLYYSIGEVAKMFDVNESLLRYWEKEFPIISPKKAGGNVRQYRKEDPAGLSSGERERDDFTGGQAETEDEQGNHYPYYGDFGQIETDT